MADASGATRAANSVLNDESLIAYLKDNEAKSLIDWALTELDASDSTPEARASRVREAMREINELVGNRHSLVADDLEERMAKLLVGELDPKAQTRLSIEREIAQVTAEKDHIAGVELVQRLTQIASRTWRLNAQGEAALTDGVVQPSPTSPSTVPAASAPSAARARPIPRPTPLPPKKRSLFDRLLGRG